jgi:hypothetical protein
MNQNDMDRYFWRTSQRWSGGGRPTTNRLVRVGSTRFWLFSAALISIFLTGLLAIGVGR